MKTSTHRYRWQAFRFILILFTFSLSSVASARALQCRLVPELIKAYLSNHYTQHVLTNELKERTIEQFIRTIDPSKSLLLQSDVDHLKKELPKLFDSMPKGDCSELTQTYDLLVKKTVEIESFVKNFIGPNYKLDESVEFVLYADKRGFPKSAEDQKKLLTALVHFQISNYLLSDSSLEKAKKQLLKRYALSVKRTKEQKTDWLINEFSEAFARSLDPHSSYLSQEEMEDFQINMQLSLEGIGVSLNSEDGYIVVQEIIPGGSADRANALKPKDKIIGVAQAKGSFVSVIDMDLRDVVKMIRGKKGTKVRLNILRQKEKTQTFEVTLVRDKVDIKEQAAKITYKTEKSNGHTYKVGILDLPSFYGGGDRNSRSSYEDVRKLLIDAKKHKIDGLILDLSRNGGGLLQDAVRISGLFIRKGPVVATQDTQKHRDILSDEDDDVLYTGPLIVLTSRISASASEILTGALKDYHRALVVGGDHTFGKGTVQALTLLPMGLGGMKLTTGMYFLPEGNSTQNKGVLSDIVLPSVLSTDDIGEKTLDYSLPAMAIEPFATKEPKALSSEQNWTEVGSDLIKKLANASQKRIEKDKEFKEIKTELAEIEQNKGLVKLAELRKKSAKDKKKEDKEKADTPAKRRELTLKTPQMKETLQIMVDWLATSTPTVASTTK